MKPKKIKKVHHRVLLVSLIVLFITMYVVFFQNKYSKTDDQSSSPQSETNSEEYTSSFLGFKFLLPSGFISNENGNIIVLSSGKNTISINRVFGYSSSVEEYLADLSYKNDLLINNLYSKHGFNVTKINYGAGIPEKYFYIKNIDTDTFVSISTSSPELYDELEQIAASFEYLGNSEN